MQKIYLTYERERQASISIYASNGWRPNHKFLFKSEDIIYSPKTPSEVLDELEDLIESRIGERAHFTGGLRGLPHDSDPKYISCPRSISWLPEAKWLKRDESPEQKEKREREIAEYNRTLHNRLFSIYQEYMQKHSE